MEAKREIAEGPVEVILPTWVKPGAKFHYLKARWHVRFIDGDIVVCRRWMSRRQRWLYEGFHKEIVEYQLGQKQIQQVL